MIGVESDQCGKMTYRNKEWANNPKQRGKGNEVDGCRINCIIMML